MTDQRGLGVTFDSAADLYQQARPDYPEQLYEAMIAAARLVRGDRLLEIGCASGKATLPLARRGLHITCVEPGPALTTAARRNLASFPDVEVVQCTFEDICPSEHEPFDLVFAATAWHWLDPELRYRRTWELLRPGGHLAFWSATHVFPEGGDTFFADLQQVYDEIREGLPEGATYPRPGELPDQREDIEASGLFEPVLVRHFDWEVTYDADGYIGLLDTFSGHIAMEPWQRRRLYSEIRRRLDERADGLLRRGWGAVLHVARRRDLPVAPQRDPAPGRSSCRDPMNIYAAPAGHFDEIGRTATAGQGAPARRAIRMGPAAAIAAGRVDRDARVPPPPAICGIPAGGSPYGPSKPHIELNCPGESEDSGVSRVGSHGIDGLRRPRRPRRKGVRLGCDGMKRLERKEDGMANPVDFMLADLREKYEAVPSSRAFDRLYDDPEWGHMFAVLHKRLNEHFTDINGRAETTRHYWADNSRDLLSLIQEIEADLHTLRRAGVEVELADSYQDALERCRPWLSPSGGSAMPEDFEPIEVIAYEPVFTHAAKSVKLEKHQKAIELKMVGSGSYAHVYSYVDPDYGIKFAVKRAKTDLDERDLGRFKQEFEVLNKLSFPYVVEVYRYDEARNEYRMEYCDTTLRDYIAKKNATISFAARKRIALQFLYGINYLHHQKLLHRDISLQNILLKVFGSGAVLVKLSDFGLVKDQASEFTRTQTEMKGTVRDPMLGSFKDYAVVNEMYAIGHVLAYIFKGRESLPPATDEVGRIIHKCAVNDLDQRYRAVTELIAEVERLEAPPVQATA